MDRDREDQPPEVLRLRGQDAEVVWSTEVIAPDTEWTIEDDRHVVILHLEGALRGLCTELAGSGTSRIEPAAGEIWTVPAGRRYRGRARGGAIRYAMLFLTPEVGLGAPRLPVLSPVAGVRDEFLHACVRELAAHASRPERQPAHFTEHLLTTAVLHLDLRYGDGQRRGRWSEGRALAPHAAERLRAYVAAHLDRDLHVAELAAVVDMPEHAFTRAVRHTFGTTPWQLVIAQRLALAHELLRAGKEDLTSIALRCGFSSHAHFTRSARKHWGETPSQVRLSAADPSPSRSEVGSRSARSGGGRRSRS